MEYLFWVWDHELLGGKQHPIRIIEEGFLDADSCQVLFLVVSHVSLNSLKQY